MPQLCFKVSESLYQEVLLTMQEMSLDNISDTLRFLLRSGLESQSNTSPVSTPYLQKQAAHYTIMAYCLMDKFLSTSVRNGSTLCHEAHDKAEKLINSLTTNS